MSDSIPEKVAKIVEILSKWTKSEMIGCSDEELENLKRSQNVDCLPEVYVELMRIVGKQGIEIHSGDVTYEELLRVAGMYDEDMAFMGLSYPSDIFMFWSDQQACGFWFFRTKDCMNDPIVYEHRGQACFYKLADRFSEFMLHVCDYSPHKTTPTLVQRRQVKLRFNPETDDFESI